MRPTWLLAATLLMALGASCSGAESEDAETPQSVAVRVASFEFAESRLIAELYAQALERNDVDVVRLGAVGPREILAPALEQGHVDVVPEYLGTAIEHFATGDDTDPTDPTDAPDDERSDVARLTEALEPRGLRALEPASAEDVNVLVVTEATAERLGLVAISDLIGLADDMTLGGPVECPDRTLCLLGLESTYGLSFAAFEPHRSLAVTSEALLRSEVDVGVMFSTAAALSSGPFVVLDDDRELQPPENIVPLVRASIVDEWGQRLVDALDDVSRHLTTGDLQSMNRRAHDGESVAAIATSWLRAVGLTESR